MFRLCLLACGAAAISTDAIVDDVDALRSALSHLRENLKVDAVSYTHLTLPTKA